jgi:hypothetical protein
MIDLTIIAFRSVLVWLPNVATTEQARWRARCWTSFIWLPNGATIRTRRMACDADGMRCDGMRCGWYAMRWYAMRWYAWRAGLRGVGREWRWASELDDVRSGWLIIVACHLACRGGSRIWQPDLKSFANLLSTWLAQVEANLDASKTTTIASRLHRQACDQRLLAAPT